MAGHLAVHPDWAKDFVSLSQQMAKDLCRVMATSPYKGRIKAGDIMVALFREAGAGSDGPTFLAVLKIDPSLVSIRRLEKEGGVVRMIFVEEAEIPKPSRDQVHKIALIAPEQHPHLQTRPGGHDHGQRGRCPEHGQILEAARRPETDHHHHQDQEAVMALGSPLPVPALSARLSGLLAALRHIARVLAPPKPPNGGRPSRDPLLTAESVESVDLSFPWRHLASVTQADLDLWFAAFGDSLVLRAEAESVVPAIAPGGSPRCDASRLVIKLTKETRRERMDPVSAIVGAIAAGAIASAKDLASEAVKAAYGALKEILATRFHRKAAIEAVEEAPDSASAQAALNGALKETGADHDADVIRLAEALAAALSELSPDALRAASIEIDRVRGYRNAIVRELSATGNVKVAGVTAQTGDAVVENVQAGAEPKKKAR